MMDMGDLKVSCERGEEYVGDFDSAIRIALGQHHEWQEQAEPSSKKRDRVVVRDGDALTTRRPFKRRGSWCVRWAGMPRLVRPHWSNGYLCFEADWARP